MFGHRICLVLFILFFSCKVSWSMEASFSWLPNSESDIDSYRLYYGEDSREYSNFIAVEPNVISGRINGSVAGLDEGQTYYFAVTAYTTGGYESNYSEEIVVQGSLDGGSEDFPSNAGEIPLEAGEITVDHNWSRVQFESSFTQPVVIAKMISQNDTAPCVVRVRNVNGSGFDVRVQEWDYLDGIHGDEVVSYFVIEKGTYELSDGTRIEADMFTTSGTLSFAQHTFKQSYSEAPVVMTSIATYTDEQAVTCRKRNIDSTGFDYLLQEQEANRDGHGQETVSYIAWELSDGTVNGLTYSVGIRKYVRNTFVWTDFQDVNRDAFQDTPYVVTDMLTANGVDPAEIRCRNNSSTGIEVLVEEEASRDGEVGHVPESVGYIAVFGE
ncbi:MAG: fibronectin type III domain-containing protein [Thermodesulfobacteriota bacterium]|nr:fibronectin type III domain-containing protein [Thermodesulfobacteriota bacterium]